MTTPCGMVRSPRSGRLRAAILALGLTVAAGAALRAQGQKPAEGGYGDLKEVALQGRVISLGDEMARKYGARLTGGGPEKQWGLALPEGQLYSFLDTESYRKLVAAGLAGQAVEIKARLFPRSMLLEIVAFKPIPAEAVWRRFFCNVCNIYFDDFGPCICCGEEVKIVR